jgi:hypothetical protein
MFWKRKHKVAPAELAEALLNEFIRGATGDPMKHLALDPLAAGRFREKSDRYKLGSVLLALAREEQKDPRFSAVREELERHAFPSTPEEGAALAGIKSAMHDLSALLFPDSQRREMSWARNWLLDIGIDETNPATLTLIATYWLDYHIVASKALQSFKPIS